MSLVRDGEAVTLSRVRDGEAVTLSLVCDHEAVTVSRGVQEIQNKGLRLVRAGKPIWQPCVGGGAVRELEAWDGQEVMPITQKV